MQGRCDEREERGKGNNIGMEGEDASSCIVNNCTLLDHDTERHDSNTMMVVSKMAGKPDLI